MKRGGSLLKNFAILALLSSAVICWRFPNKRYKRPTITYDNCGLAKLVTSNRLQINLTYNNNMDCTVVLGLPETRAVKLSIDNFQSKLHYDYIKLWLSDSEYDAIIPADEVVNHYYHGGIGRVRDEIGRGKFVTFIWRTNSRTTKRDMTAYLDF